MTATKSSSVLYSNLIMNPDHADEMMKYMKLVKEPYYSQLDMYKIERERVFPTVLLELQYPRKH